MVVLDVAAQDATQVRLVQHDHGVQAVSSDGSDQPFDEWILPGRSRGGQHFFDAEVADTPLKGLATDPVPVFSPLALQS